MNREDIIRMANKAYGIDEEGKPFHPSALLHLEIFANLVAQHEREQNAKLCEKHGKAWEEKMLLGFQATLNDAAEAIRSREIMNDKEHKVGEYIPMPKQEPVGWAEHGVINWLADKQFNHTSFLYDTPADRKWMSLTDKEIEKCWQAAIKLNNGKGADITNQPFYFLAKIVEELLMEKNT